MKTLNWRYFTLAAIGCLAFILLIAEPSEAMDPARWLGIVVSLKVAGAALAGIVYTLYEHWSAAGRMNRISDDSAEML